MWLRGQVWALPVQTIFFKERLLFTELFFYFYNINLDQDPDLDPDPNPFWTKVQDPDPNSMYLDPQHWQVVYYIYWCADLGVRQRWLERMETWVGLQRSC